MPDDASLRGDCSRCIGLCCVALAFDRGPSFGFDKPAGTPCHHLDPDHACAIHADLEPSGFAGCARYDCRGAGQLTTALFAGLTWRDGPAVARQMFAAFAKLREIQTMRGLAAGAPHLIARLAPPTGWTLEAVLLFDLAAARRDLAAWVASESHGPMLRAGQRGGWR